MIDKKIKDIPKPLNKINELINKHTDIAKSFSSFGGDGRLFKLQSALYFRIWILLFPNSQQGQPETTDSGNDVDCNPKLSPGYPRPNLKIALAHLVLETLNILPYHPHTISIQSTVG
jgi:hypothetical protein